MLFIFTRLVLTNMAAIHTACMTADLFNVYVTTKLVPTVLFLIFSIT